jgi:hemoglobin
MDTEKRSLRSLLLTLAVMCLHACAIDRGRPPTLYAELGGAPGLNGVVDAFLIVSATDQRIAPYFSQTDIARFRDKFYEHLCELSDGPCVYSGDPMLEVHRGLQINAEAFNAVVEAMQLAMEAQDIPSPTQNRLLARLAPFHRQIIHSRAAPQPASPD